MTHRRQRPDPDTTRRGPAVPSPRSRARRAGLLACVTLLMLLGACGPERPAPQKARRVIEKEQDWTSLVDGQAVLKLTRELCALGPREVGSKGAARARSWIEKQLHGAGFSWDQIKRQAFSAKTPDPKDANDEGKPEEEVFVHDRDFVNLIAVLPGKQKKGVAIAAHYDTKIADFPFVGANDAGSAVAGIIALAAHLKQQADKTPRENTLYFLFFDGEESLRWEWVDPDNRYGSRHFAEEMKKQGDKFAYPLTGLVLLDMIGSKGLEYADETNSNEQMRLIFKNTSRRVFGFRPFFEPAGGSISDDHISFKNSRIPIFDLIDGHFSDTSRGDVAWWHTEHDTPDQLDTRSMERSLTLVLEALPDVEKLCNR